MKIQNKKYSTVIAIFVLLFTSCTEFDELNTNPNTTTVVSASMLCTDVVLSVAEFNGGDAKSYISDNALAKYVGYANEGQMATQYNNLGNGSFGLMTILPTIEKMIEYAEDSPMESSYKGVAKFVRAYMFYKLTMKMGDIPYSETGGGELGVYKPKYDEQEEIFEQILEELSQANQLFADGVTFDGDPTPYNGDPEKWRKATNAFALKVLMTLSKKEGNSSVEIKNRFSEIVSEGVLLESTTGYFGLEYSSLNKHPLAGTNDIFTSKTILSELLVEELKNLNDRRLFYFGEAAGAEITSGKSASDFDAYVGVDTSIEYAVMNANHNADVYSLLNERYLNEDASEPRMLITYAEQQLILAEALIKDWISTGSVQTYYQEGVSSILGSFIGRSLGETNGVIIDQAYIDTYFTGEAALKTDTNDQLEQIWMQRYLLNFMQDSESSYFEYRRNGYPEFPIDANTSLNDNSKSTIPLRWLYPTTETSYNQQNLIEALDRQFDGFDEINKVMWLLK
ncbi:SusD/RagB family nutrient-binding outer membrane lipoprotein [Wenyingzhuangia sp. 2_MG-2023]|uniref:SusD/RagB family nutrient-binding outer membrane lipoprotein n=1 Tax=Wenyingzhuangia sp. 2_MG-2023 TaxID=3062639 RepID=UPI0026E3F7C7|nr:SusD/RagB family nutrient-binding outer membrane lipoprotein [Wenyingzhuangia sp. 2_MG-2023]MDO6738752.1 SusD/RagB family nutrient-binding outer membrane lipoprotein [Wenyingzhuangia sp. 2_MG-2023]